MPACASALYQRGDADAPIWPSGSLRPDGPWTDIGLAVESETTLTPQERNKELEYLVIAVNKAGEGAPSNTVMAVL